MGIANNNDDKNEGSSLDGGSEEEHCEALVGGPPSVTTPIRIWVGELIGFLSMYGPERVSLPVGWE